MFGRSNKNKINQNNVEPKRIHYISGLQKEAKSFLENLSVMINAGLDLIGAMKAIKDDLRTRRMRRVAGNILWHLENGDPLWKSMERERVFADRFISLVRLGEESGKLPENLLLMSSQLEKEGMFGSKIRSAMLYPSIVLPLTLIVAIGTSWYTLPKLTDVFAQMNVPLPFLTRWLIVLGGFIKIYGVIFIPAFILLFLLFLYFFFSFPKTKFIGQILMTHIPVISRMIQEVELARLGYVLGSMLQAGIPMVESLSSLEGATTFRNYKKIYGHLKINTENGMSLQSSFEEDRRIARFVPQYVQQLIGAAERSGKLSETLVKIGHTYENKLESSIKDFSTVLEPILLIIIGLAVAVLALAVMLPVYNMVQLF